jgi:membrane-bound serine protease (ClpP class)
LHGRKVAAGGVERVLDTVGAVRFVIEPDWRTRLLGVITNPGFALILMMLGIYGLLFEFSNPGFGLPGVVGGICLLLALYALQLLPISYAGLGLIALGIALMVAEAFVPSFGVLGIGGVIAFAVGAVVLIDTDIPGYGIPLGLIIPLAIGSALAVFFTVAMAIKARRQPVVSGREAMIGASGEMMGDCTREGWARVHGETWQVASTEPLRQGQNIRVTGIRGLLLFVEPQEKGSKS